MNWIFEDEGNRTALKMNKKSKSYEIIIQETGKLSIKDEDTFFKVRSTLRQNNIKHLETIKN